MYRGRNYNPKKRPVIPLMLWKPHEPVYPKLIKTTIDGLTIEETKEMRKRGLAVPALTKLGDAFSILLLLVLELYLDLSFGIIFIQLRMVTMQVLCQWFGMHF